MQNSCNEKLHCKIAGWIKWASLRATTIKVKKLNGFIELAFKLADYHEKYQELLLILGKATATCAELLKCYHTQLLPFTVNGPMNSWAVIFLQSAAFLLELCIRIAAFFFFFFF